MINHAWFPIQRQERGLREAADLSEIKDAREGREHDRAWRRA
jgi:hypothetical protein